jgi:ankyrin repeat protein
MPVTFKEKNYALVSAVANKNAAAVVASLKSGADIHYDEDFPLRAAAYLGYVEMVDLLLKNGANVHANGNEPLFTAIRARDYTMIDLLLEKGASPQAVLDSRKDKLDRDSLNLIGELQSRDSRTTAEKRMEELKKKVKVPPRPIMKMRL